MKMTNLKFKTNNMILTAINNKIQLLSRSIKEEFYTKTDDYHH